MPGPLRRAVPLAAFCLAAGLAAQGSRADYERARTLPEAWRKAERPFRPALQWRHGGKDGVWWRERGDGKDVVVAVDGAGQVRRGASAAELGLDEAPTTLPPEAHSHPSRNGGEATTVTFVNRLDRPVRLFWIGADGGAKAYGELAAGARRTQPTYAGHVWLGDFAANDPAGVFVAAAGAGEAVFDAVSVARAHPAPPPPPPARLEVRQGDVWLAAAGGDVRLSTGGSVGDPYHRPEHWSPDGTHVLGFQVEPGERREVTLVESAPKDRLQPKVSTYVYNKPGDRIDRPRPRLFDVAARRQVPVDDAPFANAWSIDRVHWARDGREVFVLLNVRGHQRLAVLAIDAATGAVRSVLEETSTTFVDYSQKLVMEWLDGTDEFLWASERDGWNHVYRVDAGTGSMRQLTVGPFVVRRIDHVDLARGLLWLGVLGVRPGEDPYHLHLARVGLDGQGFRLLTDGDGTHEWTWSPDGSCFVDRWSRVDQPWVTELRSADGARLAELGRDDATALLAAGFRPPERFVAKGRDGATDIFGILILPSTFDPARRLPIVEAVYAGPHDHFVPKAWGLEGRQRALAELGFAVVQIDGMGTNWRNRAFHDVCWRNLADGGFPDRIAWIRALAAARPGLDAGRVGVFGGSAGGQNALAALLFHGDFYKAGAADCGCHDNRMDKIWWNEAWMGWPVGPWYAENSNVTHAGKLQGALLLTVGELDHNVDPASTRQVVAALIAADKDFEYVEVPGGGHGVGESPYLFRRRQDFFVRHLLGKEPRW